METPNGLEVVRAAPVLSPVIRSTEDDAPDDGALATMEVRFSAYGNFYEIDSVWEGRFLERVERGAFHKTIKERPRDQIKVMFNHGNDPQIADKLLGTIEDLREDQDAAVGVVRLFDNSHNRDLLPGLKAGVYGSSMRMVVTKDEWNDAPTRSKANPDGIPERTIKEVKLLEFGPVTWPANPESTTSARDATDLYLDRLRNIEPSRFAAMTRDLTPRTPLRSEAGSTTSEADGAASTTAAEPPAGHSSGLTPAQRRERLHPTLKGE